MRTKRENHIGDHTIVKGTATGIKHSLSVDLAMDLGNDIVAALIFHHIQINVRTKLANNVLEDGVPYFECSYSGMCRYLIELTPKSIEFGIRRLKEAGLIKVISSNKKNKYTLTECGWAYYPLSKEEKERINIPGAENVEEANKSAEKESTKSIKEKALVVSDTAKDVIDYVNKKTGKHFDYAPSYCKNIDYLVAAGGYTKDQMIAVVDHRYEELSGTRQFNSGMNPSRLFFIKTFQTFLDDAKGDNGITMTAGELETDVKNKQAYHLREAEKYKCERLLLETGACDDDNLPFDLTGIVDTTPEEVIKDRWKKERYHRNEANKLGNVCKFIQAQSVK